MNRTCTMLCLLLSAAVSASAASSKTSAHTTSATTSGNAAPTSVWNSNAVGSQPDTPQLSPLAQQLIDYEKALPEAQKKKDLDFYKRTLTDDFVAIGTDAKVHSRAEILGDLPSIELIEYRPYNIDVIQLNEGAAVVTYDVIIRMAKYDEDTPRYQHISSIWVKQGDQWKLKFQQASAAQ